MFLVDVRTLRSFRRVCPRSAYRVEVFPVHFGASPPSKVTVGVSNKYPRNRTLVPFMTSHHQMYNVFNPNFVQGYNVSNVCNVKLGENHRACELEGSNNRSTPYRSIRNFIPPVVEFGTWSFSEFKIIRRWNGFFF